MWSNDEERREEVSYDIRFAVKVKGAPDDCYAVIGHPEHDSPTYNVRGIFVKSMDWDYEQSKWYPMTEVLPKVERGVHELSFNTKAYKDLEPDNGWGSISTALEALQSILDYFKDRNLSGLAGSWNADVPIDCIYMSW